jgi:hypothetical protein
MANLTNVVRRVSGWSALSVCALLLAAPASATPFVLELSSLLGPVEGVTREFSRIADFDFGQPFASIASVVLDLDASVEAMQVDLCGFTYDPQPCQREVFLLGFLATMSIEDSPVLGIVFTRPALRFSDDIRALSASGTASSPFQSRIGWDFLLDGRGSMTLNWNDVLFFDTIFGEKIEPRGNIYGARLIVDAVPVPEPSSASLVLAPIVLLAIARRQA